MNAKGKKASIFDTLLLLIFPLILLVVVIAAFYAYTSVSSALNEMNTDTAGFTEAKAVLQLESERFVNWWDFIVVLLIFGMWLITLVVSWILGNNPIYVIIYIMLAIFSVLVSVGMTYSMQSLLAIDSMSAFVTSFPMTVAVVNWLLPIDILFIITNGAALYLKQKTGQEVSYG